MRPDQLTFTYIGGPTAVIEWAGLRMLTDPTLDPAGTEYPTNLYTLRKSAGPAVSADILKDIDVVLLSHDHHSDNLDHAGRSYLDKVRTVLTTTAGAQRLGKGAIGLAPWQSIDLQVPGEREIRVTATPARHGPAGGDRGPVIGFALTLNHAVQATAAQTKEQAIYISGDTVWYEGIAAVAQRFAVRVAILFMGAARVQAVGPDQLTFTAKEAVQAARAFPDAVVIPLHYEGWEHFSENHHEIEATFRSAGMEDRLVWMEPGHPTQVRFG